MNKQPSNQFKNFNSKEKEKQNFHTKKMSLLNEDINKDKIYNKISTNFDTFFSKNFNNNEKNFLNLFDNNNFSENNNYIRNNHTKDFNTIVRKLNFSFDDDEDKEINHNNDNKNENFNVKERKFLNNKTKANYSNTNINTNTNIFKSKSKVKSNILKKITKNKNLKYSIKKTNNTNINNNNKELFNFNRSNNNNIHHNNSNNSEITLLSTSMTSSPSNSSLNSSNSSINSSHSSLNSSSFYLFNSKFDEDFLILKTLSKGEMGIVYLCKSLISKPITTTKNFNNINTNITNTNNNNLVVVKETKYFSRRSDYYNTLQLFTEIESKSQIIVGYSYIHKYLDFWIEKKINNNNSKSMYIVSNFCQNGNLKQFLNKMKNFYNNIDINNFYWDIIFEMMISLNYLHKIGYIHLDIKPSNYFVNEKGFILLSDFCLTLKEKDITNFSEYSEYSEYYYENEGDSIYISPELFYKNKNFLPFINHKTDIFSLGLSIYEIITNFDLPKNGNLWQKIRNSDSLPDELVNKIPAEFQKFGNLIKLMTKRNCWDRPDIENLLEDEINYKELFDRYQNIKKGNFKLSYDVKDIKILDNEINNNNFFINNIFYKSDFNESNNNNKNNSNNSFSRNDKDNNGNKNLADFDINEMFFKRSDSMKSLKGVDK